MASKSSQLLSALRKKIKALEVRMVGDGIDPAEYLRFYYQQDDGAEKYETTREHFMGEAGIDGEAHEPALPGNYYVEILDVKGEDGEEDQWSEPLLGVLIGDGDKDVSGSPSIVRDLHRTWSATMVDLDCQLARSSKRTREFEDLAAKYSQENLQQAEALRQKNREIADLERHVAELEATIEELEEDDGGNAEAIGKALEKFIPIILKKVGFTDDDIKGADLVDCATEIWQAAQRSRAARDALREAGAGGALRRLGIGDDPPPPPPPPPAPPAPSDPPPAPEDA